MVSNYVKKGLITHPVRKKYTRDQVAYLLYILAVKNVLSMENIQFLFSIQKERFAPEVAYNSFCAELESAIGAVFGLRPSTLRPDSELSDEQFLLRCSIVPAANKIYLDCCFDARLAPGAGPLARHPRRPHLTAPARGLFVLNFPVSSIPGMCVESWKVQIDARPRLWYNKATRRCRSCRRSSRFVT